MPALSRTIRGRFAPLRDRRGVVAVEFAIIAAPFLYVLFAIIESGLIFVANIDLSNATMALARQIRTGAITAVSSTATTSGTVLSLNDFKNAICTKMAFVPVATCNAQLQVDVRIQSAFGGASSAANPLSSGNFNNASLCFYSGSAGAIVEFRSFYLWPISTPFLFSALVNATSYTVNGQTSTGNFRVLLSAEAFKIEQNSSGANSGSGC